nr:hypothetical protein Iba_chr05dCG3330 [Ipomoea batatas]
MAIFSISALFCGSNRPATASRRETGKKTGKLGDKKPIKLRSDKDERVCEQPRLHLCSLRSPSQPDSSAASSSPEQGRRSSASPPTHRTLISALTSDTRAGPLRSPSSGFALIPERFTASESNNTWPG